MKAWKGLFFAIALMFTSQVNASHLLGGEIYWECTANGRWIFTLTLYRDCTGIPLPTGSASINGPQGNISCAYQPTLSGDVSPSCPVASQEIKCSSGDYGSLEKYVYRSAPITLTGVPPAGGWTFSYSSCCRPTTNTRNTTTGGYFLRSVMYPYTPPGGSNQAINTSTCYDDSPQFAQDANGILCPGHLYEFNHLPSDKDIDSLVFDWADPLASAGTPITWGSGYSTTSPLPGPTQNPQNGPVTVDQQSGAMTFEAYNPTAGWYVTCVVIREYRCGQLIGEVFRDVPFMFLPSTSCFVNPSKPSMEIDTSVYDDITRNGNVYNVRVWPRDTINFRIVARDFDQFSGGGFQTICMKAGGLMLNKNSFTSTTGCDGPAPCATLTPVNPNGTYCNTIQNTVEFNWVPDCVHLSSGGCGQASNQYFFTIRMEDNGCSAPKVGIATIVVEVLAGMEHAPVLNCSNVLPNDSIILDWGRQYQFPLDLKYAGMKDTTRFNYWRIYGSANRNGPYVVVDSITDYNQLSTTVASMGPQSFFYMERSTGACDFVSKPSDTVETMNMTMVAQPPASPERANLSWTPYNGMGLNPNRGNIYEIWIEAPEGSGNWSKVGETNQLSYVDTVSVCDMFVRYQIRVPDTITGCYSGSMSDTGTFEDRTNNDHYRFARISVNRDNKAIMEWDSDSVDDIVEFQLLYNDAQNGWIVVDTVPGNTPVPYEWDNSLAGERSEQFKVVSVDSCGNVSDELATKAFKTVFLRNYLNKCEGFSRLSWNAYEEFPNGIHDYRVWIQVTEADGTIQPELVFFIASPDDTSFVQRVIEKDYTYCYRIEARDTVADLSSFSNTVCVEAEVPRQSRQLYISKVSNDLRREALEVQIYIDGEADVREFNIQRAQDYFGPYSTIATLGKPTAPPFIINFQDFGADGNSGDYYYRVTAIDSCGGYDTISNISRNIRLRVSSEADLTNRLVWDSYMSFGGFVDRYEIYRRAGDEENFSLIGENFTSNGQEDTTFVDYDIDNLVRANPEQGDYCYYVVAVEGGNPSGIVDNMGRPMMAMSNEVCTRQKARSFLATAFRPNSAVEENQTFGPNLQLDDVERYHFYIMNRWGQMVFETKDPAERWDGTYDGEIAPSGVYIYYLKYATPGKAAEEQRGNFSLIR